MKTALIGVMLAWSIAAAAIAGCGEEADFHALDFWIGQWDVYAGDQKVGSNHIEPVLGHCALMEHWKGARGTEGKSLFYFIKATGEWKQVWVTENATARGGVKEKTLVERTPDGEVRFQGSIPLEGGGSYLDRTTLTPLEGGRVRQVIETSIDGGKAWRSMFDATYVPAERDPSPE